MINSRSVPSPHRACLHQKQQSDKRSGGILHPAPLKTDVTADALEQEDRAVLPRHTHRLLNDNLEDAFRHRYPGFRPANDGQVLSEAA
jgi:hypothetical protein